jgi:nucleotide-binding universal stress UspA family protein
MFEKILVPVDGSLTSWKALEKAKSLATLCHGDIVVAHIALTYSNTELYVNNVENDALNEESAHMKALGTKVLETAKKRMQGFSGKVDYVIEVGQPASEILMLSEKYKVTDIVIGCRGLGGVQEFFLGSVSTKVAQYAKVPVLIVK